MNFGFDYFELAEAVTHTTSARAFFAGGVGITVLAIVVPGTIELWRAATGEIDRVNWGAIVARAGAFALLLAFYRQVYSIVLVTFQSIGTFGSASESANAIFEARIQAIQTAFNSVSADPAPEALAEKPDTVAGAIKNTIGSYASVALGNVATVFNPDAFLLSLQRMIAMLAMYFSLSVIFVLKHLQAFMLALLLNVAPVCIGLAALGGVFRQFLLSWLMALIEICFWGVAMNVLLQSFAEVAPPPAIDGVANVDIMGEFVINLIHAFSIGSVPIFSAMIVRSQPASALGGKALGVAKAATMGQAAMLVAAGNLARRVGAAMVSGLKASPASHPATRDTSSVSAEAGIQAPSSAAKSRAKHFAIRDAQQKRDEGRKGD